mmetsp:Transcript_9721/g.41684  ORF Transcript_9721/g.41684 Transcript_9721/m.41684 type:complete len:251 (-) Transcript_9721:408-1160(-)
MATWLDGSKVSTGRSCVDRRDADGLRGWLEGFGDDGAKRLKAINEKDEDGRTMLHWAATTGDVRIVEILLNYNAKIDVSDEEGTTVLHSACACDHEKVARILLDKLAIDSGDAAVRKLVRAGTSSNITALHYAAGRGNVMLIQMLAQAEAKINAGDKYGNTPLFRAVGKNHNEAASLLISLGADVERENKAGDTVMHIACENGNDRIVRQLIDLNGMELLEVQNEDKKTPLDVVDSNFKKQLIMFLQGGG